MCLVHLLDQSVNVLFSVAKVATLNEVIELASMEAASWVGQLERPEKVACLLEVGANGVDFMNQILHADNAMFA